MDDNSIEKSGSGRSQQGRGQGHGGRHHRVRHGKGNRNNDAAKRWDKRSKGDRGDVSLREFRGGRGCTESAADLDFRSRLKIAAMAAFVMVFAAMVFSFGSRTAADDTRPSIGAVPATSAFVCEKCGHLNPSAAVIR